MEAIPLSLDEEDERSNIRRTAELINRATGQRPSGWISPRFMASRRTPRLLAEEGFNWHGDALNDDLPYTAPPWSRSQAALSAVICRSTCGITTRRA
jgi:hypothetical protein